MPDLQQFIKTLLLFTRYLLFAIALSACSLPVTPEAHPSLTSAPDPLPPSATPLPAVTPPPTPANTQTPPPTATATDSPLPTATGTGTPAPTYAPLRGRINVEKVSCRYGPGAMYLYLYGLLEGANQDILARNDTGSWLLTQARGDNTSCWVKASLMDINGDPLSAPVIPPDDYHLPQSPYYGPLANVTARRNGNEVIISWNPLVLRAGDDSLQTPYVLQIWACQGGQIVVESLGSYDTIMSVIDEPGCSEASHGRITAAEKHGYTKFTEIPWP